MAWSLALPSISPCMHSVLIVKYSRTRMNNTKFSEKTRTAAERAIDCSIVRTWGVVGPSHFAPLSKLNRQWAFAHASCCNCYATLSISGKCLCCSCHICCTSLVNVVASQTAKVVKPMIHGWANEGTWDIRSATALCINKTWQPCSSTVQIDHFEPVQYKNHPFFCYICREYSAKCQEEHYHALAPFLWALHDDILLCCLHDSCKGAIGEPGNANRLFIWSWNLPRYGMFSLKRTSLYCLMYCLTLKDTVQP